MQSFTVENSNAEPPVQTSEDTFLSDLEGRLFVMEALSSTIEALLVTATKGLSSQDRGIAAALDFASTSLADAIRDVSDRYMDLRFPMRAETQAG